VDAEAARRFAGSLMEPPQAVGSTVSIKEIQVSRRARCRVQWGSGGVDATLETQLDRMEAELIAGERTAAMLNVA